MVAVNDVSDGLATALGTIQGLYPSSTWRELVESPGALIFPPRIEADTLDGGWRLIYRMLVFVGIADGVGQAARNLNRYMDTDGDTSIIAALAADRTLGETVDDVEITAARWVSDRAGFVIIDDSTYWGAYLENILVLVSD